MSDLDKAIQLNSNDAYAYKFRGFAEIGLTQWDKAVADFTIASQKEPDDWQNYDRRAWANRNLKHYGEAVADYTALIKKDPRDAERLVKRGATYTAMGQYKNAITDYEAALKLAPRDSATVQRLKYAHAMLENNESSPVACCRVSRYGSDSVRSEVVLTPDRQFEFQKRGQLFIGTHNETLPVVAMCVSNPDRSPVEING